MTNETTDRLTPAQVKRINRKLNIAWHALSEVYSELDKLGFGEDASTALEVCGKIIMIRPASTMTKSRAEMRAMTMKTTPCITNSNDV